MSPVLRPAQSAGIDEDLRIRLEGSVELLESALPVLDALTFLMGRDEPSPDELALLQEYVNQIPAIDEALERASPHESAAGLANAITERMKAAHLEANVRLRRLGRAECPSLKGAASAVFELVKRQAIAPGPNERRLLESAGVPWPWAIILSLPSYVAASYGIGVTVGVLAGALTGIIVLLLIPSRPWVLLPDRIYIPPLRGSLAREILPKAIESLSLDRYAVTARIGEEEIKLRTSEPEKLVTLLCLLKGPWLSWLESKPGWSVVADAVDERTKETGHALVSTEGLLFVAELGTTELIAALTPEKLPWAPTLDEVLRLIAHVPTDRWPALTAHLALTADVRWLPKGETSVEKSEGGVIVSTARDRVRLRIEREVDGDQVSALMTRLIGKAPHPDPLPRGGEGDG